MSILNHIFGIPDYLKLPPAYFHPRVLVGAGAMLTPAFAHTHRITHVINCAFDEDSPSWWRMLSPEKYKVLNAIDSVRVNILDWYPVFEETLHAFLRDGEGCVYVHCQAGINRSGFLALAYSCKNLGMDFDTLVASVKRQRSCILQNPVFMNQTKEFINGRVQNPEAPGVPFVQQHDRYARFFTPGNRAGAEGLQDDAGGSGEGARRLASGNITPIFEE
jgi:hypothetical protein